MIEEIPSSFKYTCDVCGEVHVLECEIGYSIAPPGWLYLSYTVVRKNNVNNPDMKIVLCCEFCNELMFDGIDEVKTSEEVLMRKKDVKNAQESKEKN